jgi:Sulfotransferase domain
MIRRPIVVAAPRSGFSLLIHAANAILECKKLLPPASPRERLLKELIDFSSGLATRVYRGVFARFGVTTDLVFNGEFHLLVGGPKWIGADQPERACFRKYFGVRGMGDFLLAVSHPRELLEYYPVIHSHTAPALWLDQPCYRECVKLTSLRNPIGIINSACFSLNAMASEYVQKFMPRVSEDFLRQRLALYKLTDLDFVRGLVKFLKGYLDQFLPVRNGYDAIRWEDLITDPVATIQQVAVQLGTEVSPDEALAIWKPMDHVNLLQHHRHNYRRGKGIVGDWKNSLVNEHMEIFREFGFDRYLAELGYPGIPTLDRRDYSAYQRLVAGYIRRGETYRATGDENLFNFAFNKSNIDASSFQFKSYPKRDWTHVERSCMTNDHLVEAVSDVAERFCGEINPLFEELLDADLETDERARRVARSLRHGVQALFGSLHVAGGAGLHEPAFDRALAECA